MPDFGFGAVPDITSIVTFVLVAFGLIGAGYAAVALGRYAFRFLEPSPGEISEHIRGIVAYTVEATLVSVATRVDSVDLASQEAGIAATAKTVYASLPSYIPISVNRRAIQVPFKLFVSEGAFVQLCLDVYAGVENVYGKFHQSLDELVAEWQKANR